MQPTNPHSHSHTVHPSNPQNHRHSIYPTNLPKPFFHPYQILTSSIILTKHPSYMATHTNLHHQITITHSNIAHPHPHLHPYSDSKLQPIYHTTYHPPQLTKLSQILLTNLHLPQPPSFPYWPTAQTTFINTTEPPQHPSYNTHHKHNQKFNRLRHRHNQTNTIKPQHIATSNNNIATTLHPMPLLFHREINPAIMELLLQRDSQYRRH